MFEMFGMAQSIYNTMAGTQQNIENSEPDQKQRHIASMPTKMQEKIIIIISIIIITIIIINLFIYLFIYFALVAATKN